MLGEDVEDQLRPVDDPRLERVLEEALLRRVELVVDEQALGLRRRRTAPSAPRACPCRRRSAAPAARGAGRRGRPARHPPCARAPRPRRAPRRVGSLRQDREDEPALRLRRTWNHRVKYAPFAAGIRPRRAHARARRHPLAVQRRGGRLRLRAGRRAPLPLVHDDGESLLYAKRGGKPLVLLAGHTDTVPAQGNLPGRIEDGAVHGLGATDMKGGLAVMIELATLGRGRPSSRTTSACSSSPARSSGRSRTRCRRSSRRRRSSTRPRSSSASSRPTTPSSSAASATSSRASSSRAVGALGPAVAGRERGRARARGASRRARAGAPRRGRRRARLPRGAERDPDPRRHRLERDPGPRARRRSTSATRPTGRWRRPRRACASWSGTTSRSCITRRPPTSRSGRRSSIGCASVGRLRGAAEAGVDERRRLRRPRPRRRQPRARRDPLRPRGRRAGGGGRARADYEALQRFLLGSV